MLNTSPFLLNFFFSREFRSYCTCDMIHYCDMIHKCHLFQLQWTIQRHFNRKSLIFRLVIASYFEYILQLHLRQSFYCLIWFPDACFIKSGCEFFGAGLFFHNRDEKFLTIIEKYMEHSLVCPKNNIASKTQYAWMFATHLTPSAPLENLCYPFHMQWASLERSIQCERAGMKCEVGGATSHKHYTFWLWLC